MAEKIATFASRLQELLDRSGMTRSQLATESGISRSSITHYLKGDWEAKQDAVYELARAGGVNPAWLMGFTDDPLDYDDPDLVSSIPLSYVEGCDGDTEQAYKVMLAVDEDASNEPPPSPDITPYNPAKGHRIPILGRIAAGLPIYAEQNIEGYTITDLNGGAEYFALIVHGDSMNAIGINDGYRIIVRRQPEVENGEIAVVRVGEEDATVKRFYSTDSSITLMPQSTNPAHQPQLYDLSKTPVEVLGKVVKVEFSL